jgi:hypothetical protein
MSNKLNSSIGQMSIKKEKQREGGTSKEQMEKPREEESTGEECFSVQPPMYIKKNLLSKPNFLVRTQVAESPKAVTKLDVEFPLLFMFLHRDVGVSRRKPFWTLLAAIRVSVKLRPARRFVKSIQI